GRDKADGATDRGGAVGGEQIGDGGDNLGGARRQHDIFGDTGPDQLAIEHYIVGVAEDDQSGGGVAHLGEAQQRRRNFGGRQARLHQNQVGRRIGLVGFDRTVEPAIMGGEGHFRHAAIMDRRLDQLGGLGMLAERLDRNAGNQARTGGDFAGGFFARLG